MGYIVRFYLKANRKLIAISTTIQSSREGVGEKRESINVVGASQLKCFETSAEGPNLLRESEENSCWEGSTSLGGTVLAYRVQNCGVNVLDRKSVV